MKKSLITLLIIAMLACIGLVSCKNEVQVPAEELVSVSFENESSRALTASIEEFKPETYYWKYAAQKADTSNLISGATSTYDAAGAKWIKEGDQGPEAGFGTGNPYVAYKVEGFSQGLWNFTLYGYKWVDDGDEVKEADEFVLVYSGEITGHLLKAGDNNTHSVSAVVSPAGETAGTLKVLVSKIKLDAAAGAQVVANARIKLGIKTSGSATYDVKTLDFVTENYTVAVGKGLYQVDIQFTNDDGLVVYASGSVIATVYSGLTTTVSGSLSEALSYAEFAATSDVIATTIGTANPILEGSTATDTIKLVKKSTTDPGKVSAELSNTTAQTLISDLKTAYGADSSEDSSLLLNLSVDTVEATETTIKYEIGMEAVLTYTKDADEKTTTSNVGEVADFVTVKIELQKGLENVEVRHSGELMTECSSLTELNDKQMPGPEATDAQKAEARKGYFFYDDVTDEKKATLYIRTYTFSPFALSYTVPKYVAAIGTKLYQSVAEAFSDVKANEVITLIDDAETGSVYTISSPLVLDKAGVVFDLNGKTLTVTGNFSLLISGNNDVVKNGTIQAGANSEKATGINSYAIGVNGCDGAVLEDLVINGGVSFGGSTGETPSAAAATNSVIKDCVVTSGDFYAVCAQQLSTVTIESGEYTANTGSTNSATIQATFVGSDGPKGTITVTGGVFNGQIKDNDAGDLVLKGGLYSGKPADKYLADGYITIKTSNNKWEVVEFLPGTGTEADPYIIADIDAWMLLVKCCEYDSTYSVTKGKYFRMTNDIDVSSKTVRATVHYFAGHIDFGGHTLCGFTSNNTVPSDIGETDGNVAVFSIVSGDVSISNLVYEINTIKNSQTVYTQLVGMTPSWADGVKLSFDHVTVNGSAIGVSGNNLSPLFMYAYLNTNLIISCKNCTNNATITGSGFRSAFIGNLSYVSSGSLSFENCINNGTIISTNGQPVALLISNAEDNSVSTDGVSITVTNCANSGVIATSGTSNFGLLLGSNYSSLSQAGNVSVNGSNWDAYLSDMTLGGQLSGSVSFITPTTIGTENGCFVLPSNADAKYYQLHFSFSASSHAGGNFGYLIEFGNSTNPFDKTLPSDIKVSSWVDDETKVGEVTSYQPTNSTAGTLYLDASEHYVFNEQGSRLRDRVFVTFIAYGSNNQVLSISTYQY